MANNKVDLEACEIEFLDNGIVHTHFKDGKLVQESDVGSMFDEIRSVLSGQKCLLLVSTGTDATLTNEARALASSASSNDIIAADAIIVRDFYHQLTANVFIRHNKPNRPIKWFPSKESAVEWLLEHSDLLKN